MTNPSPEATLLLQKYTNVQIAEKVVELEADNAALQAAVGGEMRAKEQAQLQRDALKKQVERLREALEYMNAIEMPDGTRQCPWCDAELDVQDNGHNDSCKRQKALQGAELNDD